MANKIRNNYLEELFKYFLFIFSMRQNLDSFLNVLLAGLDWAFARPVSTHSAWTTHHMATVESTDLRFKNFMASLFTSKFKTYFFLNKLTTLLMITILSLKKKSKFFKKKKFEIPAIRFDDRFHFYNRGVWTSFSCRLKDWWNPKFTLVSETSFCKFNLRMCLTFRNTISKNRSPRLAHTLVLFVRYM